MHAIQNDYAITQPYIITYGDSAATGQRLIANRSVGRHSMVVRIKRAGRRNFRPLADIDGAHDGRELAPWLNVRVITNRDAATLCSQQCCVLEDEYVITELDRPPAGLIHEKRVIADVTVFAGFKPICVYARARRAIALYEMTGKADVPRIGFVAQSSQSPSENANQR